MKNVIKFFDRLEDKIRHRLSRHPSLYALIGGFGVVLFWRGVWDLMDIVNLTNPFVLIFISIVIMMLTGTFVSFFIGEQIILSGLRQEKRIDEKTEEEIRKEEKDLEAIQRQLVEIKKLIERADFK